MRACWILQPVLLSVGVKVAAGRCEVGRVTRADGVDMEPMGPRGEFPGLQRDSDGPLLLGKSRATHRLSLCTEQLYLSRLGAHLAVGNSSEQKYPTCDESCAPHMCFLLPVRMLCGPCHASWFQGRTASLIPARPHSTVQMISGDERDRVSV